MARKFGNGIDLAGQRIVNVGDGTNANDAVNLGQVQAFLRGLKWKDSVRAASTGNINLASPGTTLDGVTLAVNDRILLKNQTAPAENGIYVWTGGTVALTRALDADSAAELVGATTTVTEGNQVASATPAGSLVFTQTADAITLGTTDLAWVPVGGSSQTYLNGLGLDLTGSTFSVKVGNGILVDANGVKVDPSIVTRKFATTFNGASTTANIAHGLGTSDVQVAVYDPAGNEEYPDVNVAQTAPFAVTLTWAVAPGGNRRVVVQA